LVLVDCRHCRSLVYFVIANWIITLVPVCVRWNDEFSEVPIRRCLREYLAVITKRTRQADEIDLKSIEHGS
jgi:hypothetical protein